MRRLERGYTGKDMAQAPKEWWDTLHANRWVWACAMRSCPARRMTVSTMGTLYGQQALLAHLLGYRNGNGIYNAWRLGSVPKGKRHKMLEMMAGHNGHIWVKLFMLERKMDVTKYKYWPAFWINAPRD